ncbi:hypothetical protein GCM10009531_87800 [Actinoplanes capillaceus]
MIGTLIPSASPELRQSAIAGRVNYPFAIVNRRCPVFVNDGALAVNASLAGVDALSALPLRPASFSTAAESHALPTQLAPAATGQRICKPRCMPRWRSWTVRLGRSDD